MNHSAEALAKLGSCMSRLQEQLDRITNMQSDTALTISKVSGVVLQLSHQLGELKTRVATLEVTQKHHNPLHNPQQLYQYSEQSLQNEPSQQPQHQPPPHPHPHPPQQHKQGQAPTQQQPSSQQPQIPLQLQLQLQLQQQTLPPQQPPPPPPSLSLDSQQGIFQDSTHQQLVSYQSSLKYNNELLSFNTLDPTGLICDPMDALGPLIPRRAKVLVVEDDVAYQWLVSKHLEARGVECVLANTAADALAQLRASNFDLILMDIQLPGGLSGLDTAQRIRAFDPTTPIVSMTSSITPRQIASYLAGGMNDVLPKPFSRDGLLTLVGRFCTLSITTTKPKARGAIEEVDSDPLDPDKKTTFIFNPHL